MIQKLKKTALKLYHVFFETEIEGEWKKCYLKHTPFYFRSSIRKPYEKKYAGIPVVKNRIVVDNYMGKGYGCNGKYVTEELLKTPDKYEIIWVVEDKERMKNQFPPEVKLVSYLSEEALQAYASAKIWLCNYHMVPYIEKNLFKKEEQTYIQMWHGSLGIKKIEGDSKVMQERPYWVGFAKLNSKMTDYWISNSQFETNVFHSAFWDVKEVLHFGHARNDLFFRDASLIKEKVRKALGVREGEKFLLYVPTHRDLMTKEKMEDLDTGLLSQALENRFGGVWKVVVRLHPRDAAQLKRNEDSQLMVVKPAEAKGALDASFYTDVQELLVTADALLTDYSSCIFDFMLTGKPGFLYVADQKEYTEMRGLYYPLSDTPFPVATDNQELCEKIRDFSMDQYTKDVETFLQEKGCIEDGHATERIKELIDRLIA